MMASQGQVVVEAGPQSVSAVEESVGADEPLQLLTFYVREQLFALDIHPIKEIIEYDHLTSVPMAPTYIRGVINLRGCVVPVIDLAARFGWAPIQVTKRSCIIIVEINSGDAILEIGLGVDAVNEVLDISAQEILPPPRFGTEVHPDFIRGMAKVDEQLNIWLDMNQLIEAGSLPQVDERGETTG